MENADRRGRLFLIPSPLGENDPKEVIPEGVLSMLPKLHTYVVEATRTARRYLSAAGLKGHIQELEFHELNEHTKPEEVEALLPLFNDGNDVGLITEAGLPAVADPGAQLVSLCHKHGIEVVPCSGPSSLMLALMASGLNGQSFAFLGYIPAKTDERRQALKSIERHSHRKGRRRYSSRRLTGTTRCWLISWPTVRAAQSYALQRTSPCRTHISAPRR